MIRTAAFTILAIKITTFAIVVFGAYEIVSDPAAVGEGIGMFFGSIISGFSAASGGVA
jgi:hypothetical protein